MDGWMDGWMDGYHVPAGINIIWPRCTRVTDRQTDGWAYMQTGFYLLLNARLKTGQYW